MKDDKVYFPREEILNLGWRQSDNHDYIFVKDIDFSAESDMPTWEPTQLNLWFFKSGHIELRAIKKITLTYSNLKFRGRVDSIEELKRVTEQIMIPEHPK